MLTMRRLGLRLCGLALITACGGEATSPRAHVATVEVTAATDGVVVGHTLQLTALVKDASGNRLDDRLVTWSTSTPTLVTVSATGMVTGVAFTDWALISATSEGISGVMRVHVVPEITGEWNYTEQFGGYNRNGDVATCSDTGSYQFIQNGAEISGTKAQVGTCLAPVSSGDNTAGPFDISGNVSSTHLSFHDTDCQFETDVPSLPLSKLSGTISCGYWSGTWEATPGGTPVASVDVRWDVQTVVGGSVQLVAIPRDAAGHALSRPVTWSSDNTSVAQVSNDGLAVALAAGSAHITATSEGKAGSATFTAELVSFASVSAGIWVTCALTTLGSAYCWGWGGDGQLGTGHRNVPGPIESAWAPRAVAGNHTFAMISASYGRACGVTAEGEAYCWGDNTWGQLGDGSTTSSLTPVLVVSSERFARVTVGWFHTCGVTTTNVVYCWGYNGDAQLGDGSGVASSSPVLVAGNLSFQSVRAGAYHTCGVTTDNLAYCWGYNGYGQVGDGTFGSAATPLAVVGDHTFASVAVGNWHSCGISLEGAAWCWGEGSLIGDGTGNTQSNPVAVAGGLTFATTGAALTAGQENSCALTVTGAAYCWGHNDVGQIGDGTSTARPTPVAVSGGLSFASISVGVFHTCGTTTDALAYCWGIDANGQLGAVAPESCVDGDTSYPCATSPVRVNGTVQVGSLVGAAGVAGRTHQTRAAVAASTMPRLRPGPALRGPAPRAPPPTLR